MVSPLDPIDNQLQDVMASAFGDGKRVETTPDLLALLVEHGIAPVLLQALDNRGLLASFDKSFVNGLQDITRQEVAYDIESRKQLQAVLREFSQCNIKVLLLKGAGLSLWLYERPGLRPRSDTDLLVAQHDAASCREALLRLGYSETLVAKHEPSAEYNRPGRFGITHTIDLHFRVSAVRHPFVDALSFATLYDTGVMVPDFPARSANRHYGLLHAVFHRAQHYSHHGDRLIWLYDIHLLAQDMTLEELQRTQAAATELGIGGMFADALLTAHSWFYTSLSDEQLDDLRNCQSKDARSFIEDDLNTGIANRFLLNLRGTRGFLPKLQFVMHRVFPSPDYMIGVYGVARIWLPLLYLHRLWLGLRILVSKLVFSRASSR
jgi:hypothetical protein